MHVRDDVILVYIEMGFIYIILEHLGLCLTIECLGDDSKKEMPSVRKKERLTKIDLKYISADLIRMVMAIRYDISHHFIMIFDEKKNYINIIQTFVINKYISSPLNLSMIRSHVTGGSEVILERSEKEPENENEDDLFSNIIELMGGVSDTTEKKEEPQPKNILSDIMGGNKEEGNYICLIGGNDRLNNSQLMPMVFSAYFKAGDIIYVLPVSKDHIAKLPKCKNKHDYIEIYNFQSIISDVKIYGDANRNSIKIQKNTMTDFIDKYQTYIWRESQYESRTTTHCTNTKIKFKYNIENIGLFDMSKITTDIKNSGIVDAIIIWTKYPTEDKPRYADILINIGHNDNIIQRAKKNKIEDDTNGFIVIMAWNDRNVIIYITPTTIRFFVGFNSPWVFGPTINDGLDVIEMMYKAIDTLAYEITIRPHSKITTTFLGMIRKSMHIDMISFIGYSSIPITLNKHYLKEITHHIIKFLKENKLVCEVLPYSKNGAECGLKIIIPSFHITSKQIIHYFGQNRKNGIQRIVGDKTYNNTFDGLPKKVAFLFIFRNHIVIRSDWTGPPNLDIIRRYLCTIYDQILKMYAKDKQVIDLERTSADISQLTSIDPERYYPYGSSSQYSLMCQSARQPVILTEHDVNLLTDAQKEERTIMPRVNLTTGEMIYIMCGPRFKVINFITGAHPEGYSTPCCTSRQHQKKSIRNQIDKMYRKHDKVSQEVIRSIQSQSKRTVQYSHLLNPINTVEAGKIYTVHVGNINTYFDKTRIYAMIGLQSPFVHKQSYMIEALIRHFPITADVVIHKYIDYIEHADEIELNKIKTILDMSFASDVKDIVFILHTYQRMYNNPTQKLLDRDAVEKINSLMHVLVINIFDIIILIISKDTIYNLTPQMFVCLNAVAEKSRRYEVLLIGASQHNSVYPIYVSWDVSSDIPLSFTDYMDWPALISTIAKSPVCQKLKKIVQLLSSNKYIVTCLYEVSGIYIYGIDIKCSSGDFGFFPIELCYKCIDITSDIQPPTMNNLLPIKEVMRLHKIMNIIKPTMTYINTDGRYIAISSDRIYPIMQTEVLPSSLDNCTKVPGTPFSVDSQKTTYISSDKTQIYIKRIQLKDKIMNIIRNYISKLKDQKMRMEIVKMYENTELAIRLPIVLPNTDDVKTIIWASNTQDFYRIIKSTQFMFDYEFGRKIINNLSEKDRKEKIKDLIIKELTLTSAYNKNVSEPEITKQDLDYYINVFSNSFSFRVFAETLYNTSLVSLNSLGILSNYISILDQSTHAI